jgi:hypothetical protein
MRSDYYAHPEFGLLSPMPRLGRELRMAFFSVLFGIGIGAAAVVALSGNRTADDARVPHGVGSASVISEDRTESVLSYNTSRAAGIEKELNKDHTSKPNGSTANATSENHKTNAKTTCEGNSSCGNIPPAVSEARAMRMPAANDAPAIGRAPLGRPEAAAEMTSLPPSASAEQAHSTGVRSDEGAAERASPSRLMDKKARKIARDQNRPPQYAASYRDHRSASRIGRGYERPAGELDRAYALDRSYGSRGFWGWSR